ncbi:MAG TPA: TlpA disulfide reductase family protein [Polyangiaceae bacterium]|jgi:thiol-disulfide isomerase/thioredoxin|nr:TlpA disulfide reductase family protein [Polyangiaceae bacterium]
MAKAEATPEPAEAVAAPKEPSRPSRFVSARRWALELAVFVGLYLALTSFQERHLLQKDAAAPSFELSGLDGRRVSLESLRGKRVALHFWATWCGVCRAEQGALNAVAKSLDPDEVVYAVVADSDDADKVRHFVAAEHIEYPVLLGTSDVLAAYHVNTFPTTYYVDTAGRVRGHTVGMATRFSIRARLGLLK